MTGWDDPNSNPMADMQRAIEQDGYPLPSQAVKTAASFETAARKVAAAMNQSADVVRAKMLEMTKTSIRSAEDQCPRNAADRRTFHLAGKPYHYTQDSSGKLHTEPGESPWT